MDTMEELVFHCNHTPNHCSKWSGARVMHTSMALDGWCALGCVGHGCVSCVSCVAVVYVDTMPVLCKCEVQGMCAMCVCAVCVPARVSCVCSECATCMQCVPARVPRVCSMCRHVCAGCVPWVSSL
jgi:hypothetical protein